MQPTQTIHLNLPENLIASMNAAVESGVYSNQDEIAYFAISEWKRQREARLAELSILWEEGVASGIAEPFTLEDILAKINKKSAEKKLC